VNVPLAVLIAFSLYGGGAGTRDSVLTVNVAGITVKAGTSTTAVIEVRVKEGYHIQAGSVADEFLVPTRITLEMEDVFVAGEPVFPPAGEFRLQGADDTWMVYDGAFALRVPFGVSADAREGGRIWRGRLSYQACDDRRCLPPDTLEFDIPVDVL
jgi:DsbC/DsbD-like thiol-disulfide interchange protein